jgi:hypothetical protein
MCLFCIASRCCQAKRGNRSVLFYGETAYWVNVDVDVPLFLPIYAQRRLHDLRRIAGREIKEGFRIQGQMNFDSGWEWGYWLNDVVTARASWDPLLSPHIRRPSHAAHAEPTLETDADADAAVCPSDAADTTATCGGSNSNDSGGSGSGPQADTYHERDDQWAAFTAALQPVTRTFGPALGPRLAALLVDVAVAQADVLLFGRVAGRASPGTSQHHQPLSYHCT